MPYASCNFFYMTGMSSVNQSSLRKMHVYITMKIFYNCHWDVTCHSITYVKSVRLHHDNFLLRWLACHLSIYHLCAKCMHTSSSKFFTLACHMSIHHLCEKCTHTVRCKPKMVHEILCNWPKTLFYEVFSTFLSRGSLEIAHIRSRCSPNLSRLSRAIRSDAPFCQGPLWKIVRCVHAYLR